MPQKGISMLNKQSIIRKTLEISGSTMMSRLLGIAREILMVNYLGAGFIAEAFITAFKVPNSLRKIFAEGALTVSFVPTVVAIAHKKDIQQINRLALLTLILVEGFLLLLCIGVIIKAEAVIRLIAPGWFVMPPLTYHSVDIPLIDTVWHMLQWLWHLLHVAQAHNSLQVASAVSLLQILMSFILLLSTSALLAGPLQAVHHFFVPAFAPVLLNIFFIIGIAICLKMAWPPAYLCQFIMAGGVAQLLLHIFMYVKLGFGLALPNKETWSHFKHILRKFLPCLFSMSIMEIYVFIDTSLASYFPGSIATVYYANRFMLIPLSVIAAALSTTLLPHFSRLGTYAPRRLSFYLLEAAKLMAWIIIPVSFLMGFVARSIFSTLFLSAKFPLSAAHQAGDMLIILLSGLLFFSLNKILLNIYYGLHNTTLPMYIAIATTVANFVLSYFFMLFAGPYGIVFATTLMGMIQTLLFIIGLHYQFNFVFYTTAFIKFCKGFMLQLLSSLLLFLILYKISDVVVAQLPANLHDFLTYTWGLWLWYVPLCLLVFSWQIKSRKLFSINLYFLD